MVSFTDLLKQSDSNIKPGVKSKAVGSIKDVPNLGPPDSGISIEGEYFVEFLDVTGGEDRVVGSKLLGEESLDILIVNFLFSEGHEISLITINKIIDSRTKIR